MRACGLTMCMDRCRGRIRSDERQERKGCVDLMFDWFGLVCVANKNKHCQLPYS
jgi:hypothetical protein